MNRHNFEKSSSISHIDYHEDKKCLEVKFNSGVTYHYDCDKEHYEKFKQAESPGQHFHLHIRKFKGKKLDD